MFTPQQELALHRYRKPNLHTLIFHSTRYVGQAVLGGTIRIPGLYGALDLKVTLFALFMKSCYYVISP
jgi:hypothetical protein